MKASAVGILGEDYITAASIRGLTNRRIITSYVGRNALLPLITQLAISFAMIFGGSPLIENLFLYPGVGYFLNMSLARRDYTLMQGMFLIITVAVVLANLVAELLNSVLDPRLRVEG
jgi:peptide/nickel transport system permease protein